jgi:hypothetical protein
MKLVDLMWFYGDTVFYLTLFGSVYLTIILKTGKKDDHKNRDAGCNRINA